MIFPPFLWLLFLKRKWVKIKVISWLKRKQWDGGHECLLPSFSEHRDLCKATRSSSHEPISWKKLQRGGRARQAASTWKRQKIAEMDPEMPRAAHNGLSTHQGGGLRAAGRVGGPSPPLEDRPRLITNTIQGHHVKIWSKHCLAQSTSTDRVLASRARISDWKSIFIFGWCLPTVTIFGQVQFLPAFLSSQISDPPLCLCSRDIWDCLGTFHTSFLSPNPSFSFISAPRSQWRKEAETWNSGKDAEISLMQSTDVPREAEQHKICIYCLEVNAASRLRHHLPKYSTKYWLYSPCIPYLCSCTKL